MEIFAQTVVSGLLIGFLYALIAVGLTMIFGVMDIVNFAHGDYLMLAMYLAYWSFALLGIDPLYSLPAVTLALFVLGVRHLLPAYQEGSSTRPCFRKSSSPSASSYSSGASPSSSGRPTTGPSPTAVLSGSLHVSGVYIGLPQLVAAAGAVVCNGLIFLFLKKTRAGMALEAVAEDKEAARLMGINSDRMFALAWGIGIASVGVAGALLASFYYVFPEVGGNFGLVAFVVVALGGFGSVVGAFIAGVVVGLVEVMSGYLLAPSIKFVVVLALYLVVVLARPQGLLGKA